MVLEKISGHIAYQFEHNEDFFELGYKVLQRQNLDEVLPCIHIQYNLQDRLLFDVEQYETLAQIKSKLSPKKSIDILAAILRVIAEVGGNGFIPAEAVQADKEYIYVEPVSCSIRVIVLPIAAPAAIRDGSNDHRSWNKQLRDTIHELTENIPEEMSDMVTACLSQSGKLCDNIRELMPILEGLSGKLADEDNQSDNVKQTELQLIHDGIYGNFIFYISKKEFVIGKKRDSVDGWLGMSQAVSRLHCQIIRRNEDFYVIDMGSSNHTYVNGTLVTPQEHRQLMDGDRIRIADIDFMVRIVTGGNYAT